MTLTDMRNSAELIDATMRGCERVDRECKVSQLCANK